MCLVPKVSPRSAASVADKSPKLAHGSTAGGTDNCAAGAKPLAQIRCASAHGLAGAPHSSCCKAGSAHSFPAARRIPQKAHDFDRKRKDASWAVLPSQLALGPRPYVQLVSIPGPFENLAVLGCIRNASISFQNWYATRPSTCR